MKRYSSVLSDTQKLFLKRLFIGGRFLDSLESKRTLLTQASLFAGGVLLLSLGVLASAWCQPDSLQIHYNDVRFAEASNAILSYLEGSFGALIMVVAGLIAIISAAFGQYRAAVSCLVIAVGAFILRSFISTFFNDGNIMD